MYTLPTLSAVLAEKQITDVRTAQFLSEWDRATGCLCPTGVDIKNPTRNASLAAW
ncbi:MAG TPA: hypothetical protein VHL31_00865 [Geminicoccus sp.]|jgi:hypothetical protein|uniref:hypothetical protein n=1 Tax=Geminicoccus sp. TaxID=2024832 RepID=UPI002E327FE5|nr:hypothetical protein [Geminicoccus sp.]HEX2524841.1 hypothetical protein [Geminicoccus sp.]